MTDSSTPATSQSHSCENANSTNTKTLSEKKDDKKIYPTHKTNQSIDEWETLMLKVRRRGSAQLPLQSSSKHIHSKNG